MSPCTVVSQALLQAQAVKEHTLKQKQLTMAGRDAKVDMYAYHHLPPHHLPISTYLPPHHLPISTYLSAPTYLLITYLLAPTFHLHVPIITYLLITTSSPTSSPTYFIIIHHLPKVDMVIGRDAKGQQLVHRDIFASTNEKIVQGSCDC